MENPASQAAGSLPRRTTVQPSLALGQITSREKDLADLGDLAGIDLLNPPKDLKPKDPKRQEPAPRPLAKPIAESPAVTSTPTQKPAAKSEKGPAPAPEKWKFAAAEPRTPWKVRAGVVIAVLLLAGGGYLGYDTFFAAASTAESESEDPEFELAGETADEPEADTVDPFDDLDAPARPARASAATPRLAHHPHDAEPVDEIEFPARKRLRSAPPAEQLEPELELPPDEPETPLLTKADDESNELPLLLPPGGDAPEATAKPRIRPAVRLQRADAMSGFELTNETQPGENEVENKVVDTTAQAEQLEGFETDELENHRAISTTNVTRSVSGSDRKPPSQSAPVSLPDDDYISAEPTFEARRSPQAPARNPGSAGSNSLTPARTNSPAANLASPANPIYTVSPSDNFWNISKKQYGTGKYYAALAKHNQGRVADPQRLRPGTQLATPSAAELDKLYPELIDKSAASTASATPARAASPVTADGRPWFGPPGAAAIEARPARAADASTPGGYFYGPAGEPLYRIGRDDTLGSIAQKHLGRFSRWSEIYVQNEGVLKNPDNLTVGTVIRLPADASRVSLSPEAGRVR